MKTLLPMAYVFFILDNGIFANSKPVPINDNYTYRLMELEATDDDPDLTRYKYPPNLDLTAQLIIPRVPGKRPLSNDDDDEDDDDDDEPITRKKPVQIPKDLEEEISHFKIPLSPPKRHVRKRKVKKSAKPKRSAKKSKSKRKPKDEYDITLEDLDDDHHEEEEETEEKKEKIHKLTIKKKRPLKNATDESSTALPYRTIIETAQSGTPHRFSRPFTRITRQKQRPLAATDVDLLDPAQQPAEELPNKTVKPRDVSLILRTKNRHPRILIRRYKPYVNALAYPFLGQRPPTQPPVRKKKRRKHRKRRKKIRRRPADSGFFGSHQASSCSNDHPLAQPIDTFAPHGDHYGYPLHSDYSYEPSKFSSLDVAAPTNDYSAPYDRYIFPSESPPFAGDLAELADIPLESLENSEQPAAYEEKAEGSAPEEPMSIGYDVHEHENTAELAANHKQETDDSIEEDQNEPLQYDDVETEDNNRGNNADVDYENEAEESLRFVSMFGKTTRSKPIKKADAAVPPSQKKVKRS